MNLFEYGTLKAGFNKCIEDATRKAVSEFSRKKSLEEG
jgi:hypothetical protein